MTNKTLNASQTKEMIAILERVRRYYPMPFSVFASELLYELSSPNPNWTRIFDPNRLF